MALPKNMRLKGYRTFNYIHKNSTKYHGKLMTFKLVRSNPRILSSHKIKNISDNLRIAIAISKKVSKKAVNRNRLRRILQEWLLTNIKKINNHKPYWLLVNLKSGDFFNDEKRLLEEFQNLMLKSHLIK
ncbi:ribonuclease P protein component [Prochlorococcus marinus str. MU1404]|uniref:ribonuclease P protein component n=1 Tax=Prochlorococcus marinus TaxID=1219 RepID=UPI001ADB1E51|nr:ribonuclease P protein component [Prochlorococcus marinus]MBO8230509.1 ribonuclease P protein component [Prochlorococcus marinus XMU1404]MBW3073555.1 ribonuclease P protein component [Prochlorococcus marinus str. MU1404]MCR8545157.1 ribonuclease P protein component [Prochlorococcus marinus CUG1432]